MRGVDDTVETPFDPTKLMEVAEQLKAVMAARDRARGRRGGGAARDGQGGGLYIEFQNQFGGQLADAVPTEEFEALQACLGSAALTARVVAQHHCTSSPRSSASSSIKELIDRRITAAATVLSAVQSD